MLTLLIKGDKKAVSIFKVIMKLYKLENLINTY